MLPQECRVSVQARFQEQQCSRTWNMCSAEHSEYANVQPGSVRCALLTHAHTRPSFTYSIGLVFGLWFDRQQPVTALCYFCNTIRYALSSWLYDIRFGNWSAKCNALLSLRPIFLFIVHNVFLITHLAWYIGYLQSLFLIKNMNNYNNTSINSRIIFFI